MTEVFVYLAAFFPMLAAFPAGYAGRRLKKGYLIPMITAVLIEAVIGTALLFLPEKEVFLPFFGVEGLCLSSGGFGSIYGLIASFMWLMASLFSPMYFEKERASGKYIFFWLMTLGATVGLFMSKDLLSAFFFFELLSLSSYTWVIEEKTPHAFKAGKTYLVVAVLFGMVFFMGLALLKDAVGTLRLDALYGAVADCQQPTKLFFAGICLLLGFGAKAGMFPLHIWLPQAHPVAPSPASAILSGVLTKAGIFGIILLTGRIFAGHLLFGKLLLIIAAFTMLLGAVLGVFSTNLKKTLACSSVSQIGFILVGLATGELLSALDAEGAEGAALAFSGSFLHMINHSLLKLLLFLCAGVVAAKAGGLEFDKIRGCGRKNPLFLLFFLVGCCSLGCLPGFGGYVSKTMMHEGLVELAKITGNFGYTLLEWLFLLSGGMTICYMAKLFTVLFIDQPPMGREKKRFSLGVPATVALGGAAVAVLSMSAFPLLNEAVAGGMPFFGLSAGQIEEASHVLSFGYLFSGECLKGAGISIVIGSVLFFLIVLKGMRRSTGYRALFPEEADLENLVYKPLFRAIYFLLKQICRLLDLMDRVLYPAALLVLRCCCLLLHLSDAVVKLTAKGYFNPDRSRKERFSAKLEKALGSWGEKRFHLKDGRRAVRNAFFTVRHTAAMLSRSFAFAMTMTCMGLCLLLVYMILF